MTRRKIDLKNADTVELANRIAQLLGETDNRAIYGIKAVIGVAGRTFALQRLIEAAKIEKSGVEMVTKSGQVRTRGGVWFKLCKDQMSSSNRWRYMRIVNPTQKDKRDRRGNRNGKR